MCCRRGEDLEEHQLVWVISSSGLEEGFAAWLSFVFEIASAEMNVGRRERSEYSSAEERSTGMAAPGPDAEVRRSRGDSNG
jgi:hypothetical protein